MNAWLAAEERVRLVLVGATEAWMVAEQIAAAKVPVIVDASANLPSNFDMVHARSDAAALLHRAGVKVVLSTFDAHNVRKLRQWAGNAVRDGLPHAEALKAVTSAPAEVLGIPDRGVLAKGKIANLVVWSGDPFELSTRAEQVVVQGRPVPANHRQRALFERYRTVPPPY
jgi:imidazolonepropionase-like amidohydrolase